MVPTVKKGIVASLLWAREQDVPLRISTGNTLVAQVCFCMAKRAKTNHVDVNFQMGKTTPFIFLRRVKINHMSLLGNMHLFLRMALS
jgi:hypothetical protein